MAEHRTERTTGWVVIVIGVLLSCAYVTHFIPRARSNYLGDWAFYAAMGLAMALVIYGTFLLFNKPK